MKIKIFFLSTFFLFFSILSNAQTADEILIKYFESIGGRDAVSSITSMKMTGKVKTQGMEFPCVMLSKGKKQKISFTFQGIEMTQPCFDGEIGWQTNFMNMKAEKMEAEDSEILKSQFEDFPDPFLKYKEKGYVLEVLGSETVEGTDCFKLKLTKQPILIDGKEEENATTYFFDKENYVPIVTKSLIPKGPGKGKFSETVLSDYQETNGVMMPFSLEQKFDGQTMAHIEIEKIEMNVDIDDKVFVFPGE
ncbi:MAG: outer membrane lipoprotein-sorting protein [Saprospiraceae bacterium]